MKCFFAILLFLGVSFFLNVHAGTLIGADAGAQAFFWYPSNIGGLSFKTEGLRAYDLHLGLWPGNSPRSGYALETSYKAPFHRTDRQKDMLASNTKQVVGIDSLAFGIRADEILFTLVPSLGNKMWAKVLFSTQYQYSSSAFYGNAKVNETFYYMGPGAIINISSRTVYGAEKMSAGNLISFRTEFKEKEVTTMFYSLPKGYHEFRMGYFSMRWRRPSANNTGYTVSDSSGVYPVAYDTKYTAEGLALKWVSRDMTSPGLNSDISLRYSPNAKIDQTLPLFIRKDEFLSFMEIRLGACYNWYSNKETRNGMFLSIGGTTKWLSWSIDKKSNTDNNGNISGNQAQSEDSRLLDDEFLNSLYLRAGFRF